QRVQPAIIEVLGFLGANTAKAFHGSGFSVAADGLFVTNYHVVAQKVQYPDKYRLAFRSPDGRTGKLNVLAVDIRRDLAIVRAVAHSPKPLRISDELPAKGERAYAVGYPLSVGLTITEGVSNGRVKDTFGPRMHYSGAINLGMSGGPTLNSEGAVIGVNVSSYMFGQLLSFIVPAHHARTLRAKALQSGDSITPKSLQKEVIEQMQAHSKQLLKVLAGPLPTQVLSGYRLPAKLAPFFDCAASGDLSPDEPVQYTRVACSASSGLYLQDGLSSGNIDYVHTVLTTNKLGAWRFAYKLSSLTNASGAYGQRKFVGPFACYDKTVALTGFDADIVICTRSYRNFEGLYDFTVRVSSLNGEHHGFASHLDLYGMSFYAGANLVERYIGAMEWDG
ncbi:MAG: S1 family peptidase, partial [Hyphomicrobiaceae bacterium]